MNWCPLFSLWNLSLVDLGASYWSQVLQKKGLSFLPVSPNLTHCYETHRFIQRMKIDIHRDNAESHWNIEIFPMKSNGNPDNNMPGLPWLQNKVTENPTPWPQTPPLIVALAHMIPYTCLSWFVDGFVCLDKDEALCFCYFHWLPLYELLGWPFHLNSNERWRRWQLRNL